MLILEGVVAEGYHMDQLRHVFMFEGQLTTEHHVQYCTCTPYVYLLTKSFNQCILLIIGGRENFRRTKSQSTSLGHHPESIVLLPSNIEISNKHMLILVYQYV